VNKTADLAISRRLDNIRRLETPWRADEWERLMRAIEAPAQPTPRLTFRTIGFDEKMAVISKYAELAYSTGQIAYPGIPAHHANNPRYIAARNQLAHYMAGHQPGRTRGSAR
jgi:hypothetical protein